MPSHQAESEKGEAEGSAQKDNFENFFASLKKIVDRPAAAAQSGHSIANVLRALRGAKEANLKIPSKVFGRWDFAMAELNKLRRLLDQSDMSAEKKEGILQANAEREMRLTNEHMMKIHSVDTPADLFKCTSEALFELQKANATHADKTYRSTKCCMRILKRYSALRFIAMCIDHTDELLVL